MGREFQQERPATTCASLRLSGGFCRLIVLAGCDVFSGRPCRSSTRNSSARRDGTMKAVAKPKCHIPIESM
ncbi:hypothetical protein BHM03_00029749 [Ensete ventricosum]|nr:hypothetical protein BHM03_00029749 [Ensete ventricosum]